MPDPGGRDESLIGVRRWHADVDDGRVWLLCGNECHKLRYVGGLADDLDLGLAQEVDDPFPRQQLVLGDDDSHDITGSKCS